ncbi:MAG: type I DNA topoisomerase [Kiritimatiellae bacterium]|nr:type I DNA topoisomerase [Kiritimatiellia bacterium]
MSKLLIVESPAKAKTIKDYLGSDFVVKPSVGHIRDLPKKGLSIKINPVKGKDDVWTFEPSYEISEDKKKIVADLRKIAKESDEIYLAPDPDREGEAIAWHLKEVLKSVAKDKPFHRVTYNEITRKAVCEAIKSPRDIDDARVDAQQSRRILDRLVGFQVSPLLWKSLNYGYTLSAGRVQSVALRLLVEREREIKFFVPEAYWIMGVEASKGTKGTNFIAKLARLDGEKPSIKSQEQAVMIVDDLDGANLIVKSVKDQPKTRHPYAPFTTSTLQQSSSSMLSLSPTRTMALAQKLYEEGLITYMRTDSVAISEDARNAARDFISSNYGEEYIPEKPNFYKGKDNAQGAHEAIRPTDVNIKPGTIKLDAQAAKLYELIWRRFVASQMADAKLSLKTVTLEADKDDIEHSYIFTASTTAVVFEGFLKIMGSSLIKKTKEDGDEEGDEVKELPPLNEGDSLIAERWLSDKKETKPPPHYSEASLVKAMEENGVGRPSTYAQTIEVLVTRQYAEREGRQLIPTKRGEDVSNWLVQKLDQLFNVGYTAEMESELDKIEDGSENSTTMLSRFYSQFTKWIDGAKEPPPPREKFVELFDFLNAVKTWNEPEKRGKYVFDDKVFFENVKKQFDENLKPLTLRQLQALVKLAVSYVNQIPDGETRLFDMGYGLEIQRVKNAPPTELVKWCFQTIDRIGLQRNPFLQSLREQVDRGRILSEKQFSIMAKSIGKNAGILPDAEQVRSRLAPFVPGGFDIAPADPIIPKLFDALKNVTAWKESIKPARSKSKFTHNDKDFVESLHGQFLRSNGLSPRQIVALKRVCITYKEQIPDYENLSKELELDNLPTYEKTSTAEKDARMAARAEARAEKSALKSTCKTTRSPAKRKKST